MTSRAATDDSLPEALEQLVAQFDRACRSGSAPAIEAYLQASGPTGSGQRELLEELIKIDLEYRWRGGSRPLLEEYVARFPPIGREEGPAPQLIAWEYRVRHSLGDRPTHAEYLKRFPGQGASLEEMLAELDRDLAVEFVSSPPLLSRSMGLTEPVEPTASVADMLETLRACELLSAEQLGEIAGADLQGRDAPRDLACALLQRNWLTAYQADQLLRGGGRELVLGPYLILEPLGEGGAGHVFKARHRKIDRLAAVKVVRPDLLAHAAAVRRFYREVEAVSQLQHPNVVHAYDAGPAGTTHFLAMEYLDGIDLSRLVKQAGPLPVDQAREYIRQAALGLQYIHEHGMVHRDVKPSNLLVSGVRNQGAEVRSQGGGNQESRSRSGQTSLPPDSCLPAPVVKILDLGLARLRCRADGQVASTITGSNTMMMGTVDFMAPEQAIDSHAVDIRADVYSLGCTLYYLLTGRPPFPGGSDAEKLVGHQLKEPPAVRELRPGLPDELVALLGKMLAKEPDQRFQTPGEVAQALSGGPVASAAAVGPPYHSAAENRPFSKAAPNRRRWIVAGIGGALLLGLGSMLFGPRDAMPTAGSQRPSPNAGPGKQGPLLFEENFAGGRLRPNWGCSTPDLWRVLARPDGPGFVLDGGALPAPPAVLFNRYQTALTCGVERWSDYAVEVSVRFGKPPGRRSDHFGVLLFARLKDAENNAWLEYVFPQGDGPPILELNQVVGGTFLKAEAKTQIPLFLTEEWYTLRLEAQGPWLRAYIGGRKYLQAETRLKAGAAGLARADANDSQGRILWSNVRVERLPTTE
jgi:serine/threonine-protein kinase